MNTSTDEIAEILNSLTTVCRSAQLGFQMAAERVEDFELRAFLCDCARLRGDMADDLQVAQRLLDFDAIESEHDSTQPLKPWLSFSASITEGDDSQILTWCRSGEETAVAEFREAVEHALPVETAALVRRQFAVIVATCERLRSLERSCKQNPR